ncbi:unnamed protein product [marine sediment metagenome]|uniref:Uncharacterized protein n=1 Tax=marine sediment metagenome TaxID=412755 RepID=X0VEA8_9ZZZZ
MLEEIMEVKDSTMKTLNETIDLQQRTIKQLREIVFLTEKHADIEKQLLELQTKPGLN